MLIAGLGMTVQSLLMGGMIVGGCSLLAVLCYWLFGDSRRPFCKEIMAVLEPTYAYYAPQMQQAVIEALERRDEVALDAIKRSSQPELALVRYSDKDDRVYYSQLARVEGKKYVPLTDIIINKLNS